MRLRLSELERKAVETESGKRLGHLFDVSVQTLELSGEAPKVRMMLVGRGGLARRLGIGRGHVTEVDFDSIIRIESGRIIVSG